MADATKPTASVSEDIKHALPSDVDHEESGAKVLDTVHGDEAVKVLAAYSGETEWSEEEEKQVRRKIDRKLLWVLCVTYALLYYDKVMLGHAALFGIRQDLDLLVGDRYSFSSAIFYIGFIVGAYPATVLAQRYPIERVASAITIVWGITLILTPACHNWQGLYAERFFLGFTEAGISPMFMMIVGGWYKKDEAALRMGVWYSCTGCSAVVSPLINYGLGHIRGALPRWMYMYFFAGGITIIWGVVVYFVLLPDPVRAKGFNERQRYIAVARMRSNNSGVRNTHFKTDQLWELVLDIKFWLIFLVAICCMVANGPISTFKPIIINGFGFSGLNSLLLMMPSGFYAGCMQLLVPYLAYKFPGWRAYLYCMCQALTTLAALMLWLLPRSQLGGLLFACYILPSTGAGYAVLMGHFLANNAGYTKRSLASSVLFVGYCIGNFIGPLIMREQDAPSYGFGFSFVVGTAIAAGVLVMVYRTICSFENKRRDKTGTPEGYENAFEDDLTDKKNPQFRYVL